MESKPKDDAREAGSGGHSRRDFVKKSALAGFASLLGTPVIFGKNLPGALAPIALEEDTNFYDLYKKERELMILNDRPWNVETPAHLLDDAVTPASKMFVRNNGLVPDQPDPATWTITIDGESVPNPKTYTLAELKRKFTPHTYRLVLECGGNGRKEFNPPAKGNQWDVGAVHCAEWTGIRVRDLLEDVGIKSNAQYLGYYGADIHVSGNRDKVVISRGVPIDKAMQEESLLAYKMNGEDIPLIHGYPLRLIFGGWPASTSGKWINRISIRDREHDGPKMEAPSYRVPAYPVSPGTKVKEEDMKIITEMPVKSVITYPKTGAMLNGNRSLALRGHAWAGERKVTRMEVSIDFGSTWQPAELDEPVNRMAWQQWRAEVEFPGTGYYEVWARATDSEGQSQPMVLPGWNPKGYLNNATHRIAVKVEG